VERLSAQSANGLRNHMELGVLMIERISLSALFAVCLACSAPALVTAQVSEELVIPFTDQEPELADFAGMQPSEALRSKMAMVTGFIQREPDDGAPSSQRTEVYVAYDQRNFYAVFLAFDDQPGQVRANLSPRENIDNDDNIGILLDTFNDQRTGYAFRSSPLGVQWDGRWLEVSKTPGFDSSYEAVWYTDGQLTEQGYMVKMTIPMRTLRFPEEGQQTWRIMFERQIPRTSEQAHWPAYTSTIQGRLNQAARLTGVQDVSPGRNILLIPFAFARSFDVLDASLQGGPGFNADTEEDFGIDAKFVFRDSLVLDATYNPDFSQVESDEPQVTVNERFEVRFPERRPFFLENADYFATESALVFTRRIVDPEMGLKFTGRQGAWGIGSMLIDDEAPGQSRPAGDPLAGKTADIGIMRIFRDFGDQSRVGILYTDRQFGDTFNTVTSFDTRLKINENWSTDLQYVESESLLSNGQKISGIQRNVRVDRSGRNLSMHIHKLDTTEGFRAALGFLNRNYSPDSDGGHMRVDYRFWPVDSKINSWGPTINLTHIDDQSGLRLYTQARPQIVFNLDGQTSLSVMYESVHERLRPQDFPGLTDNRDYQQDAWSFSYESQTWATLGFTSLFKTGTAINLSPPTGSEPELADSTGVELSVFWRPIDRLRIDTTYLHTELDDQNGMGSIFSNDIFRAKFNYQFTKEWSLRFILQQDEIDPGSPLLTSINRDKNRNYDVLVRYVINPWSSLYVGYNNNASNFDLVDTIDGTQIVRTDDLRQDGEQFFVKFSYLIQP
jgi:hypothetical protein